jgi:outer membrane protein, heavy metal efflux system
MYSRVCLFIALSTVFLFETAGAQISPAQAPPPAAPQAESLAQKPGTVLITLDQAIQMAIQHNHNLLAARTVVQQYKAEETTAICVRIRCCCRMHYFCPSSSPAT